MHEETYYYFLEVLPPQYQNGNVFAFAEGTEELRVFWRSKGQYFCRQLTWDETVILARLFRTALGHLHVTAFPKVTMRENIAA